MARRLVTFLLLIIVSTVQCDYPPPSELGHETYTGRRNSPALVGTGRVTSGFGGGTYGGGPGPEWVGGVAPGADWTAVGGGGMIGLNHAKCVDIPSNLTLCRNIGYDQMRLPNLLEHDTLKEIGQQASSWTQLTNVRCHPDTQIFLCSLFAPVCLDRPVWPCRSLCEAVKIGCEDRMLKYGFPWPEMLRCDQYPADTELCIGLREAATDGGACSACSKTKTSDSIVDSYCSADFALRIKINQSVVVGSDLKIFPAKKWKVYKLAPILKKREMRSEPMFIQNGANCNCAELEHAQPVDGASSASGQSEQQRPQRNRRRKETSYLVMGRKISNRLVVDLLQPLEPRSKDVNQAMKAIRQRGVCQQGGVAVEAAPGGGAAQKETAFRGGNAGRNSGRRKAAGRRTTTTVVPTTTPTTTTTTTTTMMTTTAKRSNENRNPSTQSGGRRQQNSRNEARRTRPPGSTRNRAGQTSQTSDAANP